MANAARGGRIANGISVFDGFSVLEANRKIAGKYHLDGRVWLIDFAGFGGFGDFADFRGFGRFSWFGCFSHLGVRGICGLQKPLFSSEILRFAWKTLSFL